MVHFNNNNNNDKEGSGALFFYCILQTKVIDYKFH